MAPPPLRSPIATLLLLTILTSAVGGAVVSAQQSTASDANATPGSESTVPKPENDTPRSESDTPESGNVTPESGNVTPESENVTPEHESATARFAPANETPTFVAAPGQTVRGETSLPSGTDVEVWIQSTEPIPFLELTSTTVREDGRFSATFDISDVTIFEPVDVGVSVRRDGETLARASGTLYPANESTDADDSATRGSPPDGASPNSSTTATTSTSLRDLSDLGVRTAVSGVGSAVVALFLFGSTAFVLYRR